MRKRWWPLVFLGLLVVSPLYSDFQDMVLSGWSVRVENVTEVEAGYHAERVHITLPGILGGGELIVPDVTYDRVGGQALQSGWGTTLKEIRATNGFRVSADRFGLGLRGIALGGKVFLPDTLGGIGVQFPLNAIVLLADGTLFTDGPSGRITVQKKPFPFEAERVVFGRSGVTFLQATILLPNSKTILPMGDITFLADGSLLKTPENYQSIDFEVNGFKVHATNFSLSDSVIRCEGSVFLPAPFNESFVEFTDMVIDSEGVLHGGTIRRRPVGLHYLGFFFTNREVGNFSSRDGIQFSDSIVDFPKELGGAAFHIYDFRIRPDGTIDLYGFPTPEFYILGQMVQFGEIGIDKDGFWGKKGVLYIPKDFSGDLAGRAVSLDVLRVDAKGIVTELKAGLDRGRGVALNDSVFLDQPKVSYLQDSPGGPLVILLQGSLMLSQVLGDVSSISVTGLPVDLKRKRFDAARLKTAPLRFTLGGLSFDLSLREAKPRFDLLFSGTAEITDPKISDPAFHLSGNSLSVDSLRITAEGALGAITLSVPGDDIRSLLASYREGTWNFQPFVRSSGLPINVRVVVNQERVTGKSLPSETASSAGGLPVGTVLVIDFQSPDVDTIGEQTDHWYHFKPSDGKSGWIFGALVDVLQ